LRTMSILFYPLMIMTLEMWFLVWMWAKVFKWRPDFSLDKIFSNFGSWILLSCCQHCVDTFLKYDAIMYVADCL
jgi:hypothetical protein